MSYRCVNAAVVAVAVVTLCAPATGALAGTVRHAGTPAQAGTTSRIARTFNDKAPSQSTVAVLSPDGRFASFSAGGYNYVPGQGSRLGAGYLVDLRSGERELVTVNPHGPEWPGGAWVESLSAEARHVVYSAAPAPAYPNPDKLARQVWLLDRQTEAATLVSRTIGGAKADGDSQFGMITPDGRYVVYESSASNLVPGDDNGGRDVFRFEVATGTTTRISAGRDGAGASGGPRVSADGRFVTYTSDRSDLVAADANGRADVFCWDATTGTTTRISVGPAGEEGDADSMHATISADGNWIAYTSFAPQIVPGAANPEGDVYLRRRDTGHTVRVSTGLAGAPANGQTGTTTPPMLAHSGPTLSADGRVVVYYSAASNLVAGDGNEQGDIFRFDRSTGATTLISRVTDGTLGNGESEPTLSVSDDGTLIGFQSTATNLDEPDRNGTDLDVYLHRIG